MKRWGLYLPLEHYCSSPQTGGPQGRNLTEPLAQRMGSCVTESDSTHSIFFPSDQTGKRGSEKVVGGAWEESEKGNKWKVGSHHHLVLLRPPPPQPKGKKKTESPKSNYLTPTNLEAPSIPLLHLSPFLRIIFLSHSLFLSPS